MMLTGCRRWLLRLFKNFWRRDSLRRTGRAGNYLWWEDMGKEQMSVDTTRENKHGRRTNLCKKFKRGIFNKGCLGNILGSTYERVQVLTARMTFYYKSSFLCLFSPVLFNKLVLNTYYVPRIRLLCLLPTSHVQIHPYTHSHFEVQIPFVLTGR